MIIYHNASIVQLILVEVVDEAISKANGVPSDIAGVVSTRSV